MASDVKSLVVVLVGVAVAVGVLALGRVADADVAPIVSPPTPPSPEPVEPASSLRQLERLAIEPDPRVEDTDAGFVVAVAGWDRRPFAGARVIVAAQDITGPRPDLRSDEALRESGVVLDARTESDGMVTCRCRSGQTYFVHVEDRAGVPAFGRADHKLRAGETARLEFVLGRVLADAFRLSDGTQAVDVRWSLATPYSRGQAPAKLQDARERLAAGFGLTLPQVFAGISDRESVEPGERRLSVYHERIGWFTTDAQFVPLDQLTAAREVVVPESGVAPPVDVTVNCHGPDGQPIAVSRVMLSGGGARDGFPSMLRIFPSGQATKVAPGRYQLGFPSSGMSDACTNLRIVEIEKDCTLRLDLRWLMKEMVLVVRKGGRPYLGSIAIHVGSDKRLDVVHSRGPGAARTTLSVPEGARMSIRDSEIELGSGAARPWSTRFSPGLKNARTTLTVPVDRENAISVEIPGQTRRIVLPPHGVPDEYPVEF